MVKAGDRLQDLAIRPDGKRSDVTWTVREILDGPGGRQYAVMEAMVPTEKVIETDLIGPRRRYRPLTEETDA